MPPIRAGMDREERARWLARLFDETHDHAVVLVDTDGCIAGWPSGAQNVFGYAESEVLGKRLDLIYNEEDQASGTVVDELASARIAGRTHDDRWHRRKDGSRFWASGAMLAFRDGEQLQGYAKILRDRTDLRTQIETLKNRLQTELTESARKDALLASVAHEMRSPLAPLANALELIRITAGHEDRRYQYPMGIIERQLNLMKRLTDDLLDFERARQGKLSLSFRRVSLTPLLTEAINSVRPAAQQKEVRLEFVAPTTAIEIEVDPDRFLQIIVNLLSNAVKYTPPKGCIWVKVAIETGHAAIRVEDTGVGIPADVQPRLFELFTQGKDVDASRRESGLGVGLALVKTLVALHNGTISVRSEGKDKGSEFTARLPLRQPGPEGNATGPSRNADVQGVVAQSDITVTR